MAHLAYPIRQHQASNTPTFQHSKQSAGRCYSFVKIARLRFNKTAGKVL